MSNQIHTILSNFTQNHLFQSNQSIKQCLKNESNIIRKEQFFLQRMQIELILLQSHLIIKLNNSNSAQKIIEYSIKLDFSIIIQQFKQKKTLQKENQKDSNQFFYGFYIFKKQTNKIKFYHSDPEVINQWMNGFSKLVSQKGFSNQFKSIKYIGRGQFAQVWQVQRIKDNLRYAAKIVEKDVCFGQINGKEALYNQIQILKKLNHPNTINLQSVYQSEKRIYILMNLIQGESIIQFIQNESLQLSTYQFAKIFKELLKVVQYLHSQGLAHRDLKPGNIIIDRKNLIPYIVDFGLSESIKNQNLLFQYCGSPGYMAPQLFKYSQQKLNLQKCDIYSLGAIFYLLLTKRPLFQANNVQQIINQNKDCEKIIQKKLKSELKNQQADLLSKMLNSDPKKRISIQQALDHQFFIKIVCQTLQQYRNLSTSSPGKYSIKAKNLQSKFQELFNQSITVVQNNFYQTQDDENKQNKNLITPSIDYIQKIKFRSKRYLSQDQIDTHVAQDASIKQITWSWRWKKILPFDFIMNWNLKDTIIQSQ